MSELAEDFMSLPSEHQSVLRLAQDQHNINIKPLQQLKGGRSGAFIRKASWHSGWAIALSQVVTSSAFLKKFVVSIPIRRG